VRGWRRRRDDILVRERVRPVEVPVLTETKRLLGRDEVAGALEYAYPIVVRDLERAYGVAFPEGYTHEEIVLHGFTEEMRPLAEFFDRLYRLYAPVRYGHRPPPGSADDVLELLQSLYSPLPMWRLYLAEVTTSAAVPEGAVLSPSPHPAEGP
jgi:hypothetical protein